MEILIIILVIFGIWGIVDYGRINNGPGLSNFFNPRYRETSIVDFFMKCVIVVMYILVIVWLN